MNIFSEYQALVGRILGEMLARGDLPAGTPVSGFSVEPPRDPSHGDLATNAAMVLARPAGMKPRDLAERLVPELRCQPDVAAVEVAGPGFINLRLRRGFWQERLRDVLRAGTAYGDSRIGAGRRVNVEYVSANPTGPMHVGHCRGAVFGDALAALLEKAGFEVCREYYINDAGAQVDVLARSAHLRYREALGEQIGAIPEGLYPGDYLVEVSAGIARSDKDTWLDVPESQWGPVFRERATKAMMDLIKEDLALLGIRHEVFTHERDLHEQGKVDHALAVLRGKGLVYEGVLEPPKGKLPDDWEPRPQLLFRATSFGDDVDRPLKKSDGSWTYFAADIAYHLDKLERGFTEMIDVWGADHGGYVKRMQAAVKALSDGRAALDIKLCQLVNLLDNGQPVRMSKRAGSFVTLRDVVEEVGAGVVRFIMLTRKNDAPLDFDFAKVREQSKDNPVFYVQYAHARVCSVLRNAREAFAGDAGMLAAIEDGGLLSAEVSLLDHPAEIELARLVASWPRQVESAAEAHEPHRVALYLYDLAASFHSLWNLGKDQAGLRFINPENRGLTLARLAMIRAVARVIASGLTIMGVEPAEEMR
ncbi:MAG: arginine--tRNA ligase [Alphaproteobacteria bacterium]|nr:arginine--tRNA ligase [Alphaproteobacteria bacterium]